jgi:hypothetical protein
MDNPKQERRNDARRRALKRARITFMGRRATIDCTVLNLSDRGGCLKVGLDFRWPLAIALIDEQSDYVIDFVRNGACCHLTSYEQPQTTGLVV